jgi:hypothetical protein
VDLFDPDAVGDPTHQSHDWEPGIAPSGLFWTVPISDWAIDVEPGAGRARFHARDVAVTDYHDFFNAVFGGGPTPVPAHVSFDVSWSGNGDRQKIRDEKFGFAGHYVTGATTISFKARNQRGEVIYASDHAGQYNPSVDQGGSGSPAVGHERNGVFFHEKHRVVATA